MTLDQNIPMIPPTRAKVTVSILAETEDYNHRIMNIPSMWKRTMGKGVKLVVLDTGLPKHSDLRPCGGKSFIEGYLEDKNGHSMHCAGIIAAIANNGMGVKGIAPDVEDYYGAVLDADGSGTVDNIIKGIYWAVDEIGADIISMSLGITAGIPHIRALEQACQYAVDHGTAVFAAAGNEYGAVGQPACYDCVFAVAAVNSALQIADFSNKGKEVDYACGGVNVFSTFLNNTYAKLSGTSMATPACAAAAALILADARQGPNPRKLSPAELGAKLRKICFDLGPAGWDQATGNGLPLFTNYGSESDTPDPLPEPEPEPEPSRPGKFGKSGIAAMPAADCLYWRMFSRFIATVNAELDKGANTDAAFRAGLHNVGHNVALINRSIDIKT